MTARTWVRRSLALTFPILLLGAGPGATGPTPNHPALQVAAAPEIFPLSVDRLDNGLTIVSVPMGGGSGTTAYFTMVNAGSRDEVEAGKSGYAHLFEHLMFRGTKATPPAEYEKKMQALGADNNASTNADFTFYTPLVPKDSVPDLIPIEADRFMHLDVAANAYKDETGAVLGEYNKDASNPYWAMNEAMREVAFTRHTYGHTTIGYKRDVEAMPQSQAYSKAFFSRFYTPDDCVIFVVGDFDKSKVLELVRAGYGAWQGRRALTATATEPEQTAPRSKAIAWKSPTAPRLQFGYKVPAAGVALKDIAAISVLATLVFGESSDLYQRLVVTEQKLLSLSADPDDALHKDTGLFRVDAKIKPGAATFDAIGGAIQDAVTLVATGAAKTELVEAARTHLSSSIVLEAQTPTAVAERLAYMTSATGDVHGFDRYMDEISKVTAEDLTRVAKAYLVPARRTTITLAGPGALGAAK